MMGQSIFEYQQTKEKIDFQIQLTDQFFLLDDLMTRISLRNIYDILSPAQIQWIKVNQISGSDIMDYKVTDIPGLTGD